MAKTMAEAASEIESALSGRIQVVGEPEEVVYTLPVAASSVMDYLSEELFRAVELMSPRELPITCDDVKAAMRWLLNARLAYVSGIKSDIHPRDVEYPALMGPVLAAIGKWRDPVANVTLVPTVSDDKLVKIDSNGYVSEIKDRARLKELDTYRRTISALRVLGVATIFGLPLEKTVETDEFFRIDTASNILCGSRSTPPSAIALYSRALVEVIYLSNLFGDARIQYTTLASVRNSVFDILMRNIDGPRVRPA